MAPKAPVVDRLLARMRAHGDFPAMAQTVGLIGHLTSSETTSASVLADTVLRDYGLTQKLLRLVNTTAYAQYDQVTTISRAVLLLGFDRVRSVATGLILFEHLREQAKTPALADALNMSFYSAILARVVADRTGFADPEEAFIAGLFHNLGRTLVAFHLPEEVAAITLAAADPALEGGQDAAVVRVLGMSYSAIGTAVAEALHLPAKIAETMARMDGTAAAEAAGEIGRLACLATLASDVTDVLADRSETRNRRAVVNRLFRSYGDHFTAVLEKQDDVIASAVKELRESSRTFRLDLPGSAFMTGLGEWRIETLVAPAGKPALAAASATTSLVAASEGEAPEAESPASVLTRGLHEITSLLATDNALDDVLRVILETIYRAFGVGRSRVFFLLKDPAAPVARFRFGLGQSSAEMKTWFEIPLGGADDLFSLAVRQMKDLVIRSVAAPEIASLLPAWYRRAHAMDRFVVLLPLVVEQKPLGLFYVDGAETDAAMLTPPVVNFLKVLRGQAVLAIRQKSTRPQARR